MEKKVENLVWVLVGLVAVIAAVAIITSVLFGGSYTNGTFGPFGMMGGYYGMGLIMPVIGIISVIFVIVFVFFILDALRGSDRHFDNVYSYRAEDIARERFAKGEIAKDDHENMKLQFPFYDAMYAYVKGKIEGNAKLEHARK